MKIFEMIISREKSLQFGMSNKFVQRIRHGLPFFLAAPGGRIFRGVVKILHHIGESQSGTIIQLAFLTCSILQRSFDIVGNVRIQVDDFPSDEVEKAMELDTPFDLPGHIRSVTVDAGRVTVTQ